MRLIVALFALIAVTLAPVSPAIAMAARDCVATQHSAHHQSPPQTPGAKADCCTALVQALAPLAPVLAAPDIAPAAATAAPIRAFTGIDPTSEDPPPRSA